MDWAKAKNILIIIFLLLNLFLVFFIGRFYNNINLSKDSLSNTLTVLKDRGVIINCEIPSSDEEIGTLGNSSVTFDAKMIIQNITGEKIDSEMSDEVTVGTRKFLFDKTGFECSFKDTQSEKITIDNENIQDYLEKIMKNTPVVISRFFLDKTSKNLNDALNFTFRENYKGYIVFDNYVMIEVKDSFVTKIKCKYRKIDGFLSSKKIVPAYQVLLKNFAKGSEVKINDIRMGFKEHVFETGAKELDDIPVWCVRMKDREDKYFKAYSGDEIVDF